MAGRTIPENPEAGERVASEDNRGRWFVLDDYDQETGGPLAGIVMSESDARLLVYGAEVWAQRDEMITTLQWIASMEPSQMAMAQEIARSQLAKVVKP